MDCNPRCPDGYTCNSKQNICESGPFCPVNENYVDGKCVGATFDIVSAAAIGMTGFLLGIGLVVLHRR